MHDGFSRHPLALRLRPRPGQIEPVDPPVVIAKHVMAGDRKKPQPPVHYVNCEQDFAPPDQGAADHGEHGRRQRLQGALCALYACTGEGPTYQPGAGFQRRRRAGNGRRLAGRLLEQERDERIRVGRVLAGFASLPGPPHDERTPSISMYRSRPI